MKKAETTLERLADNLADLHKASGETGPHDAQERQQIAKAATPAQLEYLRAVSPAAAVAWEQHRPAT